MRHPIQPLVEDEKGEIRFKANAIVRHLLDHGGIDESKLALLDFPREDWEQFAQLIGYSLDGACDLSFMSDEVLCAAEHARKTGASEAEARAEILRHQLEGYKRAKDAMREGIAILYGVDSSNLEGMGEDGYG